MRIFLTLIFLFLSVECFSKNSLQLPRVDNDCYNFQGPYGSYTILTGTLPNHKNISSQENIHEANDMRKKQEELLKKNGCKAQLNDTQYYSSSDGKSANFCFTIVLGNCLVLGKDYKCPSGYSTKYYDSNDRALGNICVKLETYSGPRASPHGAR